MKVKEIVARARWYERYDEASPADCLLSVMIDLFTDESDDERLDARTVQQAWEKLTRELSVTEWLEQCQAFTGGVDILAGNLAEAGRRDLAATLRTVAQPRFEGAARSPEVDIDRLRRLDDAPDIVTGVAADGRLWARRGQAAAGHGL